MRRATSYQLLIEVSRTLRLPIGRLGVFEFAAGQYVYTGSAKRSLEARIARHCRAHKSLRWHIDYLLASPSARVVDVATSTRNECALNRAVPGIISCEGFGASDCRAGCGAHLKYVSPRLPAERRFALDAQSRKSARNGNVKK